MPAPDRDPRRPSVAQPRNATAPNHPRRDQRSPQLGLRDADVVHELTATSRWNSEPA